MFPLPSGRELERERGKLERQEKKIITDIKKTAKTGQMVSGQGMCLTFTSHHMQVLYEGLGQTKSIHNLL